MNEQRFEVVSENVDNLFTKTRGNRYTGKTKQLHNKRRNKTITQTTKTKYKDRRHRANQGRRQTSTRR